MGEEKYLKPFTTYPVRLRNIFSKEEFIVNLFTDSRGNFEPIHNLSEYEIVIIYEPTKEHND